MTQLVSQYRVLFPGPFPLHTQSRTSPDELSINNLLSNLQYRGWKMAQKVRSLAALADDPVPRTHKAAQNHA